MSPAKSVPRRRHQQQQLFSREEPYAEEIEGNIIPEQKHHLGGYADVWRGKWIRPDGTEVQVAIKYLRCVKMSTQSSRTPEARVSRIDKRLRREVYAWVKLSHPNVTPLLGYQSGPEPLLITPFYENGNLEEYLMANPGAPRLKLVVQAAAGLRHLHSQSPAVVHGDIRSDNVLINNSGDASLCDFGLARIIQQLGTGLTTSGQGQGGKGFIAPELLDCEEGDGKTKQSDVYAFGGLMLHTLSGNAPFYHQSISQSLIEVCMGRLPPKDKHSIIKANATIWNLMERCWTTIPEQRPDMKEVQEILTDEEEFYAKTGSLR
ncbi:hypothetical protein FRB97_009190 [Tulasnella sp. 331]|nr:hypothetical protein FRB97_009190 [Tulasnella sp. 331]